MRTKWIAVLLAIVLLCAPTASFAKTEKMNPDVPVWTEDTVKAYATQYIKGENLDTLWGYYDVQVRRYMPMEAYESFLTNIKWMTGEFIEFGTYSSFSEANAKTKTHVLHLCMEKQDLDLYFTVKDEPDDWEVMAMEFAFADEQETSKDMLVNDGTDTEASTGYTESTVKVGGEPYLLDGVLTIPDSASAEAKVPGVVLVHGSGPNDRDESIGETKLFADIAKLFAEKGIATLRYDKRTFAYGASMTAEEVSALTVEEETIQDAIAAGRLLAADERIDASRVVLLGHSMGAMLAPRIAGEAEGVFKAMLLVAGSPKSLADIILSQNQAIVDGLEDEQQATAAQTQIDQLAEQLQALRKLSAEEAKQTNLFGVNGYYFWEMEQHDAVKLIEKLKLPTYIVQGNADWQVTLENGVEAYEDALGDDLDFVTFKIFRGLNHLLMKYEGSAEKQGTIEEYNTPAHLDEVAGRDLAAWVLQLGEGKEE